MSAVAARRWVVGGGCGRAVLPSAQRFNRLGEATAVDVPHEVDHAATTLAAAGPGLTFHSLRHTHASHLIAAGMDVITVSCRLGHGSPTITLGVYGHLFSNTDDRAAQIIEAAFSASRTE